MKKKIYPGIAAILLVVIAIIACNKEAKKSDSRGTEAGLLVECDPATCIENICEVERDGTVVLKGVLQDTLELDPTIMYQLHGKFYVDSGAMLVIPPGTLIQAVPQANNADASALIVTRGGKIYAEGTVDCPITFTSAASTPHSGDWGGIVILGNAPVNKTNPQIEGIVPASVPPGVNIHYGGADPADESGVLLYVRILYAGVAIAADDELNGLTCGGVGNGTILSHIQVYKANDDAFQFFGGTVNADHLYAYVPDDDAFDFELGYTGTIQFAVSVLNNTDDYSANPNGIESDNDATGSSATPKTLAKISNMTVVGVCDSIDAKRSGDILLHGAHLRRNTGHKIYNSIIMGFPTGVYFDWANGSQTITDTACFRYNLVHAFDTVFKKRDATRFIPALLTNKAFRTGHANDSIKLVAPCTYACPDLRPQVTSPAVTGANFADPCIATAFPQITTYKGAFAPCNVVNSNWLAGWTKH